MVGLFAIQEYKKRIQRTKEHMVRLGIDVLLITDPANMNYLSGYDAWSFYVHQMLVLLIDEEQPYWIGREIDRNAAVYTAWLDENHLIGYPDDYVQSESKHPMQVISQFLMKKKKENKRIAVEQDSYYFTAKSYLTLIKNLPNATFLDGTNLVNWVRLIKSDKEMNIIKKAGKIAEHAMQTAYEQIEPGVKQSDAAAAISHAQISGTKDAFGGYPAIVPLMATGEKTSACHLTWTDDVFLKDDPVIIELAGCYHRYHVPLARTIVLGNPDKRTEFIANVLVEGIEAALDAVKPGATCEEVESAWANVIKKHGITKDSRIGYSIGLNYPPDWGEHTASIRAGDHTVLQPNMTFHMIPGIWLDDLGVEFSESFRVTNDGYELLTQYPRKLLTKPTFRLA